MESKRVDVLKRFGSEIGAESEREDALAEGEPGRLTLVGAVFIAGQESVGNLGKFS